MTKAKDGHRQNLRDRFLNKEPSAFTDEQILELLLTYAIPLKDVRPLAAELIKKFGSLQRIFSADIGVLSQQPGIKEYSAILIKLVDWISNKALPTVQLGTDDLKIVPAALMVSNQPEISQVTGIHEVEATNYTSPESRRSGGGLFSNSVFKETLEMLPRLPDTDSLDEIKSYLKTNLHFSAEQTRSRYANYIVKRMFKEGYADQSMRSFAQYFAGRQELRDVCFYRFCKAEPLMARIAEDLLIPSLAAGTLKRNTLKEYLYQKFPQSKSIKDAAQAIIGALVAGGMATANRNVIIFSYREVLLPSFGFILHSEFHEPGMYNLDLIERNPALRLMLWRPDRLLPSLFELRNQGIISKVSEIDNIRQFTTNRNLEQAVADLISGEVII